jgi:octaprenyl-diphosphate synthase
LELIFRKCTKKLAHSILFATFASMIDRKQIEEPVAVEFKHFNEDFDTSLRSQTALLESAIEKVMASTGKHIRPLLLLLAAKTAGR